MRRDRLTAELNGAFVVMLIGMRIHKWLPVARSMSRMLAAFERQPSVSRSCEIRDVP